MGHPSDTSFQGHWGRLCGARVPSYLFYTVPPAPSKDSPVVFNITVGVKLMSFLTKRLAENPQSMKENLKRLGLLPWCTCFSPFKNILSWVCFDLSILFVFFIYYLYPPSLISLPPCLLPSSFSKLRIPFLLLCLPFSHLVLGISATHLSRADSVCHSHSWAQRGWYTQCL